MRGILRKVGVGIAGFDIILNDHGSKWLAYLLDILQALYALERGHLLALFDRLKLALQAALRSLHWQCLELVWDHALILRRALVRTEQVHILISTVASLAISGLLLGDALALVAAFLQ